MQRAVKGERGYGQAIDYRGEPVVSAWSYLPSFRWGMVVKQDSDEAFAMIDQQRLASGLLLALTVASVAWVAWSVARSITPADPRGRAGRRPGRRRRSDGHLRWARPLARRDSCSRRSAR